MILVGPSQLGILWVYVFNFSHKKSNSPKPIHIMPQMHTMLTTEDTIQLTPMSAFTPI